MNQTIDNIQKVYTVAISPNMQHTSKYIMVNYRRNGWPPSEEWMIQHFTIMIESVQVEKSFLQNEGGYSLILNFAYEDIGSVMWLCAYLAGNE